MSKPTSLSDTARSILSAAADRDDYLALPPDRLPAAAQRAVVLSLLKTGLLEEVSAEDDQPAWRTDESGLGHALRVTVLGLRAVRTEPTSVPCAAQDAPMSPEAASEAECSPEPPPAAQDASAPPPRGNARQALRSAAQAVLLAWDDPTENRPALPGAMDALRTVVAASSVHLQRASSAEQRQPRAGTKQETVLALLRRPEGASGPQLVEATDWAPHTVRGFLTGLACQVGHHGCRAGPRLPGQTCDLCGACYDLLMRGTTSLLQVRELSTAFRASIEACDRNRWLGSFIDFPAGCCGNTADLLAEYLRTQGYDRFECVSGERGSCEHGWRDWTSHAWLEGYGLTVDITADQFPDVSEKVLVVGTSAWHARFRDQERRPPGIDGYACAGQLWAMYSDIVGQIESLNAQ